MLRGHFVGANGSNLAIVLNGVDHILESIELNEFLWWDSDLLWLTDIAIKFLLLSIFIICGFLSCGFGLCLFSLCWLLQFSLGLSSQVALVPIDIIFVLIVEVWHLLESVII
jgi:hypothetical protein